MSDSTGNTRLSRDLLAGHVNLVFNIPDICHHLSNALKDIVKLDHFKPVRDQDYLAFHRQMNFLTGHQYTAWRDSQVSQISHWNS